MIFTIKNLQSLFFSFIDMDKWCKTMRIMYRYDICCYYQIFYKVNVVSWLLNLLLAWNWSVRILTSTYTSTGIWLEFFFYYIPTKAVIATVWLLARWKIPHQEITVLKVSTTVYILIAVKLMLSLYEKKKTKVTFLEEKTHWRLVPIKCRSVEAPCYFSMVCPTPICICLKWTNKKMLQGTILNVRIYDKQSIAICFCIFCVCVSYRYVTMDK